MRERVELVALWLGEGENLAHEAWGSVCFVTESTPTQL